MKNVPVNVAVSSSYFVNLCMFPQIFNDDLTLLPHICWANNYIFHLKLCFDYKLRGCMFKSLPGQRLRKCPLYAEAKKMKPLTLIPIAASGLTLPS